MTIQEIEESYCCDKAELGLSFEKGGAVSFRMWAPLAARVDLLLYAQAPFDAPSQVLEMRRQARGLWSRLNVDCQGARYYKYRIANEGQEREVCDIWGRAASADSAASQIVNINSGTDAVPAASIERYDGTRRGYRNPWRGKSYTDAVVYEMHIRDWSRVEDPQSTGTFLDIAEGTRVIPYLRGLGVTHVQLMPCFSYAGSRDDPAYNWGYNPYNYMVPEGRYVRDMRDGSDAVAQFRTLVQKFHAAGIAVVMDVVYNHTDGTGDGSLYDMTVPGYFYRLREDGTYANGSGCGNELATNHVMVRKFVLESLRRWMLDYHVNGFRFDLMGCHEADFIKEAYGALSVIDKNVMVYGEPWTGGESMVAGGVTKESIDSCCDGTEQNGVACFNDLFRDAIKGAEFGCFNSGQVQGAFNDEEICRGLTGSQGLTGRIGRMINYAECHDNYTLFDKLALCRLGRGPYAGDLLADIGGEGLAEVKKQDALAGAYVLLAQGTPFLGGGQEFLRTKRGDGNSFRSGDEVNQISLDFAQRFADVQKVYAGLIALRKANRADFGANRDASASAVRPGVTRYAAGAFLVYFNATGEAAGIDAEGCRHWVDVSGGSPSLREDVPSVVEAKSFVILKR